jgi:hypothetical protein
MTGPMQHLKQVHFQLVTSVIGGDANADQTPSLRCAPWEPAAEHVTTASVANGQSISEFW